MPHPQQAGSLRGHPPGADGLDAMVATGFSAAPASSPADTSDSDSVSLADALLARRREEAAFLPEALGVFRAAAAPAVTAPSTARMGGQAGRG